MSSFTVNEDDAGQRLDLVLAHHSRLSRSSVQKLIEAGLVCVGDQPASKRQLLQVGTTVSWEPLPEKPQVLRSEPVPFTIIYEDEWLLVVDKPAGVVVHPGQGNEYGTLVQGLLDHGVRGGHERRPGIVHRLDKETSGLLIVARSDESYQALVQAMSQRTIKRTYAALLSGSIPQDEGTIDAPIGRHIRDRKRMSVHTAAPRRAVTHFTVRRRYTDSTLAEVRLETGRTHQIRVHFSALGYPVVGDATYGRRTRPEGLTRHFLHAESLAFAHPEDGRELAFTAPLPEELRSYLESLEGGAE